MLKKLTSILILFFFVVAPQLSQVSAQSYLIEGCGKAPFIDGLDILEMSGINTTLTPGAENHSIEIKYDTEGDFDNLYLEISTNGKSTFTTEQVTPVKPPGVTNYKRHEVNFSLTDPELLQSFSETDSREFKVRLLTK